MTVAASRRMDADVPPANIEAETAVLGAVLLEGAAALERIAPKLDRTDFYIDAHRTIYSAMLKLVAASTPVDVITVAEELRSSEELHLAGGPAKLALLLEQGAIAPHLDAYASIIIEAARKRGLLALGIRLTDAASNGARADDVIVEVSSALEDLGRRRAHGAATFGLGLGDFLALPELDESEPYIEGLLPSEGGGWIGGEEKLGKTYYALEEALCLALGLSVCERFAVPARRRVFFVEEEDSPRRTKMRVRALLRGHELDPESDELREQLNAWFRLEVWSGFSFDRPGMVERLREAIEAFEPAVVYVDVLRKVTLRDLNKADQASALLATLDDLRRRYGVVFRVLHHYRKTQTFRVGRGSQEISGSFVLGAWGESSLFFEPVGRKHGGAVRVTVQLKDGASEPFLLKVEPEGPRHAPSVVRLHAEDDRAGDDADEVVFQAIATLPAVEALAGRPGVPVLAVATSLKRSDKTVRRALKRLQDAGRVLVTGQASKGKDLYGVNA